MQKLSKISKGMKKGKLCFISIDVERKLTSLDKLLEILKKYNVAATLFVIGEILRKYPDLFKKLAENYEIASFANTAASASDRKNRW